LKSKTPLVVFQFLVVRPNEHQVDDVRQLAKDTGVDDVWFKTAQVYDYENDPNGLIPRDDKYSRYRKTGTGYRFKGRLANHCWRLWHDPVITWDGLVAPCCFDKDAQHQLGDLKKKSFREIWKNGEYSKFRAKILQGRNKIDICSNCSEGTKVWEK
jgi:radical SAM protein with 4Fe4S-binding SPASM domain